MCRKKGSNPNHNPNHIGASKGIPAMAKSVIRIFNYADGSDERKRAITILAKKLVQRDYTLQVFQKYWNGRNIPDKVMEILALEHLTESTAVKRDKKIEAILA